MRDDLKKAIEAVEREIKQYKLEKLRRPTRSLSAAARDGILGGGSGRIG